MQQTKEHHEEARFLGQRSTPRDEQRRSAWGSLLMSMQTLPDRCPKPRCLLKAGHNGDCYPKERT